MLMENIRKALDTIALNYSQGKVSVDVLIKACQAYKKQAGIQEDFDSEIRISKSLFDSINGVEPDPEISKAIAPGQTKSIDGVMYIYSPTAPGSKQPYDWHVITKVGSGAAMDAKTIDDKNRFINELFPKDLSSLKFTQRLGGSTGAVQVSDVNGNLYVKKSGFRKQSDGSEVDFSEHVKSEYLANQLYDALGLRVPQYELYEEKNTKGKNEAVLLSKWISKKRDIGLQDYPELAKGFIADVLLANWDVYQNDNCFVDMAGRVIRVDNGSCLDYRAKGQKKVFDDNVLKTFEGMVQYNPSVYNTLSSADVRKQINDIRKKKKEIVGFLRESGYTSLGDIISKRIDNLSQIEALLNLQIDIENTPILPRKLKGAKEMYADISDKQIEDALKDIPGGSTESKINASVSKDGNKGWVFLEKLGDIRGFSARPKVVTEDEYWKLFAKNPDRAFLRGLQGNSTTKSEAFVKSFMFEDRCFYGTEAAHGQGIYAAVNDNPDKSKRFTGKGDYTKSTAWAEVKSGYAYQSGSSIMKGILDPSAKTITQTELEKEIRDFIPVADKKLTDKIKAVQKAIDKIDSEVLKLDDAISNVSKKAVDDYYKKMHFNEADYTSMVTEIEGTNWGAVNAFGERDIPSYKDFVEGKMVNWVKAQGGTANIRRGVVDFVLPNSDETFSVNIIQYNGPFSIKHKGGFSPHYNIAVSQFQDWMNRAHINPIQKGIEEIKTKSQNAILKLNSQKRDKISERNKKSGELDELNRGIDENNMFNLIHKNKYNTSLIGIWAMLKGYDAIIAERGNRNQYNNSYFVILNRSKVIVSNKVDKV